MLILIVALAVVVLVGLFVVLLLLLHRLGPSVGTIDKAIDEQISAEHKLAKHRVHFRWQQRETAIVQRVERAVGRRASPELRQKIVQRFRETHR